MRGVRADEARHFFEEDEDPPEVFAALDAAEQGRTSPSAPSARSTLGDRIRHAVATVLRSAANSIDPSGIRAR
jgi:hypothetical protein